MTRVSFAAAALVACLSGCAQVKEVSYDPTTGSGVVAVPSDSGLFESMNRRAAMALIEKRVGPNFEIVDEQRVSVGQQTMNNQQVNGGTSTSQTTMQDLTEWHIAYRKKAAGPLGSSILQTRYPSGAASGVQQASGLVPSVLPGAGQGGWMCADGKCATQH
jgi:hypothetical protein